MIILLKNETIIIFEKINDCPKARTSLKSFALDKRFKIIATGSLLGVLNYRRKSNDDIQTGYEKIIEMTSLDFEGFLWANGLTEDDINLLKEYTKNNTKLPIALVDYYKEMINRYIVIGGMPESIKEFLKNNNYIKSREYLISLIKDYRADFGRFINDNNEEEIDYHFQEKINKLFDSIPSQLARVSDTHKFKYSEIKKGGRGSELEKPFEWLANAGLILRCFNLKAIELPLEANIDKDYFKVFISDIGLLMAMYPISTSASLFKNELDSRKGAIYENLAAIMIKKSNLPLYYFSNGRDHLEIDFIIESTDRIILLEEKSTNGKMAASKNIMEWRSNYKANKCYKIIKENFVSGSFYTTIPYYALLFLLDIIKSELDKGIELPKLNIQVNN